MCNACGVMGVGCSIFQGAVAGRRPFALGCNRVAVKNHVALRARIWGAFLFRGFAPPGYTMSPLRGWGMSG